MNDRIYTLKTKDNNARRGEVDTPHGRFQTPAFMPVGTSGAVKALTAEDLENCGAEIMLSNTYHLYLRPGTEIIKSLGGLARFNGWNRPTLTDSGGYQVFSLRDISRISDDGVKFQSHHDGSYHLFTPEKEMEIPHDIGADIIMAFDQCVPYPADRGLAATGVRRTFDWAKRCREHHHQLAEQNSNRPTQHLFGIVQGSTYKDLRTESAEQIVSLDFPGNAIGGLSVGESKEKMEDMLAHTIAYLPDDKLRYMMGIGYPEDILMAVSHGVDMFDFTSEGPITYRNADFAADDRPLDPNCSCKVCQRYSRAYIRHLYNQSEITGMVLASYHSTWFFQDLMRNIRQAIEEDRFDSFRREFLKRYAINGRT